jgi:hypothetical protein
MELKNKELKLLEGITGNSRVKKSRAGHMFRVLSEVNEAI